MRKLAFIAILILSGGSAAFARHIKGGEISYVYIGAGSAANTDRFQITLRLFLDCNASGQQLDPEANIGIYSNDNNQEFGGASISFQLTGDEFINLSTPNPCIKSPSAVCYRLRTYSRIVELPRNTKGYTCVFQRCCRIDGLSNLSPNMNVGSSYTCVIHGAGAIGANETNSSPSFSIKDTVLICQNRPFQLDFSAEDPDKDSLSYEFSNAYGAPQGGGGVLDPVPPSGLYYVGYAAGFSGTYPLGSRVSINPSTGLISGIAPAGGDYVISVTVKEWRKGKEISEHRKDFNIRIDNQCDLAAAALNPDYQSCDDFTFSFQNESPPSSLIHSYYWDFGVTGTGNDTSALATPRFTYPDTGVYQVKLVVNRGEQCSDSATGRIHVFPLFKGAFQVKGSCLQNPYYFSDQSQATYGQVNKWSWNFGDEGTASDTSSLPNTSWRYSSLGMKTVSLIVASSKGCIDTVKTSVEVRDKPALDFAFRDTLICSIDSLQLKALGNGSFNWSPSYNIISAGTSSPIVYPARTTWYTATLNDNGCVNSDSVRVRVVDFVTLEAGPDSIICLSDTVQLSPQTDGLYFSWTPANTLNDPQSKNPLAFPGGDTRYRVTASIGKCSASDEVLIRTIPYPLSDAGPDTSICFEDTAHLHARIGGASFVWSPTAGLSNPNVLDPDAYPKTSITYQLRVYDTLGCPKPGISLVKVQVKDQIFANAGNDTSIVVEQPLQLHGTGSELIQWSPASYLSNPDIANPIAYLSDNFSYVMKAYTPEGCYALDTIHIKVFKTKPDIFVPNAFAPGGTNRVLRPILVGIAQLDYFRVYNRWGQLVFQTSQAGTGWDGSINGRPQETGTFVWMVQGKDFLGNTVRHQGTAVLIR